MKTDEVEELVRILADRMEFCFSSTNEMDRNGECAGVVDGLFAIARGLTSVAVAIDELTSVEARKR